jgi:hypothetical protein
MKKNRSKKAIALLITVFFIMAITISLGVVLKSVKKSSTSLQEEHFMVQSSIILDDILKILQDSKELSEIKDAQDLSLFLDTSSKIFFDIDAIKVEISLSSARAKLNPNTLTTKARRDSFKNFLSSKMINTEYGDMLFDIMGGIKEDMSYNTDIFNDKPYLFRDYVASFKHLDELNESYLKAFYDNNLKNIKMQELFYISKDTNTSIDLNYATPLVWEVLLGCDELRATTLSGGRYESVNELELNDEEKTMLKRFKTSFYEPYIDVKIKIIQKDMSANIRFEYNIVSKRGSGFVFEV